MSLKGNAEVKTKYGNVHFNGIWDFNSGAKNCKQTTHTHKKKKEVKVKEIKMPIINELLCDYKQCFLD